MDVKVSSDLRDLSTQGTHWFIKARLKTRQLLLLLALDEEGSIQRAAQILNMSQPAASKLMKDLEDVLGVPLFERHPRGMLATGYGETMIRHARMAIANLNDAYEEIDGLKAGRLGQVRVGAITAPGITLLPSAIALIRQSRPNLNLSLQIETSDVLVERLVQGKLDMVIGRIFSGQDKTHLRYEPLVDELVCAMTRPGHPLLTAPNLRLHDLAQASWIVPPVGSVLRHRFEQMFQEQGLEIPGSLIETTAILFITKMLQQSDQIAVIATDVARYYAEHGLVAILPIPLPCQMEAFGLITRTDRLLSPAAMVTLQLIRSAAMTVYGIELPSEEFK
jgi:molybdate transport repressor ModE-like protein